MEAVIPHLESCHEGALQPCVADCPFQLNVPKFVDAIVNGNPAAALRTYSAAVGFPRIVSECCTGFCVSRCILRERGDAPIRLKRLEAGIVALGADMDTAALQYRPAGKSVLIVGGGLAGSACALLLLRRGHQVTIVEKSRHLGGRLKSFPQSAIYMREIETVLGQYDHTERRGLEWSAACLDEYGADSIFLACDMGDTLPAAPSFFYRKTVDDVVLELAGGFRTAMEMDRYLRTGVRRDIPPAAAREPIYVATRTPQHRLSRGRPEGADIWKGRQRDMGLAEDIIKEAERCLKCACDACIGACDLMAWFRKYPRRISEEISVTVDKNNVDGSQVNLATKLIASCLQCGMCGEACGENIALTDFLLESRRVMHQNGRMPWAYHEFWVRDMLHANGDSARVMIAAPESDGTSLLFFPGCQMAASDPMYVEEAWEFLKRTESSVGLLVCCCGAPAIWAGDTALHERALSNIKEQWIDAGRPEVVLACPNCGRMFRKYLPEIKTSFLYERFRKHEGGLSAGSVGQRKDGNLPDETVYGVFDPCAAREFPELQEQIRVLLRQVGIATIPLPAEKDHARCCGFGGAIGVANPEMAADIVRKRIETDVPYITYCTNCRDIFKKHGKQTYHILDVVFGHMDMDVPVPSISNRRVNRERLKARLSPGVSAGGGSMTDDMPQVVISDDMEGQLEHDRILKQDVIATVLACEGERTYFENRKTGLRYGSHVIGHMTYWVVYRLELEGGGFMIENAYSHRVRVATQGYINGR